MHIENPLQDALTPRQRLDRTRGALAEQLARRSKHRDAAEDAYLSATSEPAPTIAAKARRAARVWWHRHPVHGAVDFARPALEDYARKKPMQLVGIAAGTGAALTLLKSWHVLSLTGVAFALLKSSDIKATAKTLFTDLPT